MARFAHIPPEAVLKEDLLRTGMAFDDSALTDNLDGEVKPKSYFIFSFDQKPLAQLGEAARRRPPEELALTGGPVRAAPDDRLGAREPGLALPRCARGRRRAAPLARRPRDRRRRLAADAGVLPARARERQDRDGDSADDPVGLPRSTSPSSASASTSARRRSASSATSTTTGVSTRARAARTPASSRSRTCSRRSR